MPEGIFSPLHILLLLVIAFIVFGFPLLTIVLSIRWANKRHPQPGTRISIPGVLAGGITDVFSSSILSTPLVAYVMVKFGLSTAPSGHGAIDLAAVTTIIHASPLLYGLQLATGLGCSALGGYVAAWAAKHDELLNGLLSSFLCIGIGLYSIFLGKGNQSLFAQMLLLPASATFALLGGYLRQTQKRSTSQQASFG